METKTYLPKKTNFDLSNDLLFFLSHSLMSIADQSDLSVNKHNDLKVIHELVVQLSQTEPGDLNEYISSSSFFKYLSTEGNPTQKEVCNKVESLNRAQLAMVALEFIQSGVTLDDAINDVKDFKGHNNSAIGSNDGMKHITYSECHPITINPFALTEDELNIEKKDFLNTLICLLWKGADGKFSQVETDIISNVISAYYAFFFDPSEDDLKKYKSMITELNFNSFYEFAIVAIPHLTSLETKEMDFNEFRSILKKFYKGGSFDTLLN